MGFAGALPILRELNLFAVSMRLVQPEFAILVLVS